MLKVELKRAEPNCIRQPVSNILIGITFTSTFYDGTPRLFLKTYSSLVMLSDPSKTWENSQTLTFQDYKEVNVICKVE